MLPEQAADTQGFSDSLPHPMVVQRDVLFEQRTLQRLHLVHRFDIAAAQQLGQLFRIQIVIFVAVFGDQAIAARLAAVRREVEKINPRAWIQEAVRGQLPHAVLFMRATEGEDSGYSCFAYEKSDAVLDRNRLEQLLKRLPRGRFAATRT